MLEGVRGEEALQGMGNQALEREKLEEGANSEK